MVNQKRIRKSGSVNIPVAMRRDMALQPGDAVDVQMREGSVILTPSVPRCQLCENTKDVTKLFGKYICRDCASLALDVLNEKGGAGDE